MDDQTLFNIFTVFGLGVILPLMWAVSTAATQYYATRMPEAMPSHRSTVKAVHVLYLFSVAALALAAFSRPWPLVLAVAAILVPVMVVSIVYTLRVSRRFHAVAVPAA